VAAPDDLLPDPARDAAVAGGARSTTFASPRRRLWQIVALVLALAVTFLVIRAYGQPGFILDFANFVLC
jgi:hypothetical protein